MKENNNLIDEISKKLLDAIEINDIRMAKDAIIKGANVNVRKDGITALGRSVWKKNKDLIELLLENHANVNIKNLEHQRALHYAAWLNEVDICTILLAYHAEVDGVDIFGNTPLFKVINNFIPKKGEEVIHLLLEKGANPDKKNNYEISAKDIVKDLVNTKVIATIFG